MQKVQAGHVTMGDGRLVIIAGPCVAESQDMCMQVATTLAQRCESLNLPFIFKASFDKANRSSIHSSRGPGLDAGLAMLDAVRSEVGCPVTTDVHEPGQAQAVGQVADVLQVPAFLCRQTDLLAACAQTGKPVNVKKGQFMSPGEMVNVAAKLDEAGAAGVIVTERGTFFGYHRLVNDFTGLGELLAMGRPVCFDVTHSTQQPGGQGTSSGGQPEYAPLLARAAVAAGVHALFIETHPEPSAAMSDAATMLPLDTTTRLLSDLAALHQTIAGLESPTS